jgi:hypothetical protein
MREWAVTVNNRKVMKWMLIYNHLYILYNKFYTLNSFITNYMFILEVSKAKSIISVYMLNIVDQRKKEAISKKKDEKGRI